MGAGAGRFGVGAVGRTTTVIGVVLLLVLSAGLLAVSWAASSAAVEVGPTGSTSGEVLAAASGSGAPVAPKGGSLSGNYTVQFKVAGLPADQTHVSICVGEDSVCVYRAPGPTPLTPTTLNATRTAGFWTPPNPCEPAVCVPNTVCDLGLPLCHVCWSIACDAVGSQSLLNFSLPNGTFSYDPSGSPPGYVASGGSFTVNGANLAINVAFVPVETYPVTFTDPGLPSGDSFNVYLGNAEENYSSNGSTSIAVYEPAGDLNYMFAYYPGAGNDAPPAGYAVTAVIGPKGTTTQVTNVSSSGPTKLKVKFSSAEVTNFDQTGFSPAPDFPYCPLWWVWDVEMVWVPGPNGPINGIPFEDYRNATSNNSTIGAISIYMYGGSWHFTITHPCFWKVSPAAGTIRIPDSTVTKYVRFKLDASKVTIHEKGLASGDAWGVIGRLYGPWHCIDPAVTCPILYTANTSTSSLSILLVNGTWNYTFTNVSGYVTPSGGQLTVVAPHSENLKVDYQKT